MIARTEARRIDVHVQRFARCRAHTLRRTPDEDVDVTPSALTTKPVDAERRALDEQCVQLGILSHARDDGSEHVACFTDGEVQLGHVSTSTMSNFASSLSVLSTAAVASQGTMIRSDAAISSISR